MKCNLPRVEVTHGAQLELSTIAQVTMAAGLAGRHLCRCGVRKEPGGVALKSAGGTEAALLAERN